MRANQHEAKKTSPDAQVFLGANQIIPCLHEMRKSPESFDKLQQVSEQLMKALLDNINYSGGAAALKESLQGLVSQYPGYELTYSEPLPEKAPAPSVEQRAVQTTTEPRLVFMESGHDIGASRLSY